MTFAGFDLPPELARMAGLVGDFVREEIVPAENALGPEDRGLSAEVSQGLRKKAKDAGLWCFQAPKEYGGLGMSSFEGVVLNEQMGKHKFSFPSPGAGVFGIEPPAALYKGTPEQIEKYVRPTIEHGLKSFAGISEPGPGSDPARSITTTAVREGDNYRINGHKMWITGADHAQYGLIYARTSDEPGRGGISTILVDIDTPGMTITTMPVTRDIWPTEILLEDVVVPVTNLVGEEGSGFGIAQAWMGRARLRYAAQCVGVAEEALRIAIEWSKERETFGARLATRQAVQFMLADARMNINAIRHLTWEAAWNHDQGRDVRVSSAIAKVKGTEMAFKVVDDMMQILGGRGMLKELPLEHWFRGLKVSRITEGPSEIHRFLVARDMLGAASLGRK